MMEIGVRSDLQDATPRTGLKNRSATAIFQGWPSTLRGREGLQSGVLASGGLTVRTRLEYRLQAGQTVRTAFDA